MDGEVRKIEDVINLIIIILAYSAINKSAKVPLLYSVLNPETNSDSPSAKSNGDRLVSARIVMNQDIKSMGKRKIGINLWPVEMENKEREDEQISGLRRINTILTSYEIVWATLRKEPRRAYLELEDQPAAKVE